MKAFRQEVRLASQRGQAGMAVAKAVVALALAGLAVGAIVNGYIFSVRAAEKNLLLLGFLLSNLCLDPHDAGGRQGGGRETFKRYIPRSEVERWRR